MSPLQDDGPKTPPTTVNMDAPQPQREHDEPSITTDAEGRTLRVMGTDEQQPEGA